MVASSDGYVASDGQAAWAFVAHGPDLAVERAGPLAGVSSHEAEWIAVTSALEWAEGALTRGDTLELHIDSALVAKGLASRRPTMSGDAAALRAGCRQALARLGARRIRTKIVRVPREQNREADALARQALERHAARAQR